MRLVIFDIDGTLTQTMNADEECFVRSLAEVCGFTEVDTDWSHYKHATDSGIFHELYQARTGRAPSTTEVLRFRQTLLVCSHEFHLKQGLQPSRERLSAFAPGRQRGVSGCTCYRSME